LIDVESEIGRKEKELVKAEAFLASLEGKLGNANFVDRAKPEVVARERERADEARERIARLEHAIHALRGEYEG